MRTAMIRRALIFGRIPQKHSLCEPMSPIPFPLACFKYLHCRQKVALNAIHFKRTSRRCDNKETLTRWKTWRIEPSGDTLVSGVRRGKLGEREVHEICVRKTQTQIGSVAREEKLFRGSLQSLKAQAQSPKDRYNGPTSKPRSKEKESMWLFAHLSDEASLSLFRITLQILVPLWLTSYRSKGCHGSSAST